MILIDIVVHPKYKQIWMYFYLDSVYIHYILCKSQQTHTSIHSIPHENIRRDAFFYDNVCND